MNDINTDRTGAALSGQSHDKESDTFAYVLKYAFWIKYSAYLKRHEEAKNT
jgi:hypothetical protein